MHVLSRRERSKPPFTRYADEFWGGTWQPLERGYLRTVYSAEVDKFGGHGKYLNSRIKLIKRILAECGG